MNPCCTCCPGKTTGTKTNAPLICLVPRNAPKPTQGGQAGRSVGQVNSVPVSGGFVPLDDEYIRKHFSLPQRALYLDPFERPLITFPLGQDLSNNFNMYRKTKTNQKILDGILDGSEAIVAPSVFPYTVSETDKKKEAEENEEIIYILQLPDWESKCPIHNEVIRTPRFIWHSCKKKDQEKKKTSLKRGGGPLNKPKPWLLSRHTDFDLMSQW